MSGLERIWTGVLGPGRSLLLFCGLKGDKISFEIIETELDDEGGIFDVGVVAFCFGSLFSVRVLCVMTLSLHFGIKTWICEQGLRR